MNYGKIIEDYQKILKDYGHCKKTFNEEYQNLTEEITLLLSGKTPEEYSKYFSDLFEIWLEALETDANIIISSFDDYAFDKKYKTYREQTTSSQNISDEMPIAASRKIPIEEKSKDYSAKDIRREKLKNLLYFSSLQLDKLHDSKKIIEYVLNKLWLCIFQKNLSFLNLNSNEGNDENKKECSQKNEYFHKNWPLYELINQISSIIYQLNQDGKSKKVYIDYLPESKKYEIIENTDNFCKHILEIYILGFDHKPNLFEAEKHIHLNWIPMIKTSKEILLPHIIATSDLVSYIFEYKLMQTKAKNKYLEKVKNNVVDIYNKLIIDNVTYTAIDSYIQNNNIEDIIITYKKHSFSPKIVLIFVISIIQEIVRKTLTQSRNNIFYNILQAKRDKGFDENTIITKVEKDVKAYMLIYRYFDEPVSATYSKKNEKINEWVTELNKLRYGVLDDYLFDLANATEISFEEEILTSIKTSKKIK